MAKSKDTLARELQEIGDRRRQALADADQELERALRLAPAALKKGISVKRVAELAAVSRPTLYARLGLRRGDD